MAAASLTISRCSTIRSAVTDLMTGFCQQSLSEGTLNGSRMSSRLVTIECPSGMIRSEYLLHFPRYMMLFYGTTSRRHLILYCIKYWENYVFKRR